MDRRNFLTENISKKNLPISSKISKLSLNIADVRVDILTSSHEVKSELLTYFHSYLELGPARAEIYLEPFTAAEYPTIWEDPDPEFYAFHDCVVQRDFVAKLLKPENTFQSITRAVAWINPNELHDAIHNLLRWFLSDLLLESNGFLVHGAGVVKDGMGYAFFGPSGAGKSTCAQLISDSDAQALVIGDDAIIIRKDTVSGQTWLYSAPLGNGYSRVAPPRCKVPLKGLFSLCQDSRHFLELLTPAEAVRVLMGSAMSFQFGENGVKRIELCMKITEPPLQVGRLHFKKDAGFWNMHRNRNGEMHV